MVPLPPSRRRQSRPATRQRFVNGARSDVGQDVSHSCGHPGYGRRVLPVPQADPSGPPAGSSAPPANPLARALSITTEVHDATAAGFMPGPQSHTGATVGTPLALGALTALADAAGRSLAQAVAPSRSVATSDLTVRLWSALTAHVRLDMRTVRHGRSVLVLEGTVRTSPSADLGAGAPVAWVSVTLALADPAGTGQPAGTGPAGVSAPPVPSRQSADQVEHPTAPASVDDRQNWSPGQFGLAQDLEGWRLDADGPVRTGHGTASAGALAALAELATQLPPPPPWGAGGTDTSASPQPATELHLALLQPARTGPVRPVVLRAPADTGRAGASVALTGPEPASPLHAWVLIVRQAGPS